MKDRDSTIDLARRPSGGVAAGSFQQFSVEATETLQAKYPGLAFYISPKSYVLLTLKGVLIVIFFR